MYDLAVIGAGPAGYVAAEKAGRKGKKVILFEKKELGGVCVNEGCIPTKALLHCAKIYEHSLAGDKFGVNAEGVSADFESMMKRKARVVKRVSTGIKVKMREAGVEVVQGQAVLQNAHSIECGGTSYEFDKLLICTGSSPARVPIPGLDSSEAVVDSTQLLSVGKLPESLIVIGGGVIGMEFASLFNSLGTKVHVIEMLPEILGNLDNEVSALLRKIYSKKSVVFHLGCRVESVDGHKVGFRDTDGNYFTEEAELILMCTGRQANIEAYGLENTGVVYERKGIRVDSGMKTNVDSIYAAGDVTGSPMLAHSASLEASVAVENMFGAHRKVDYSAIPGVVYTTPEVAGVGLTEEAASEAGMDFRIRKLPMAFSGRFLAENENVEGFCKIITDSEDVIKGVHMIGNPCSELIHSCCIAVSKQMKVQDFEDIVFPHPTVSEILKETLDRPTEG